jgi:hypothetical protein
MSNSPASAALAVIDMARNGQFADLCARFAPPLQPMVSAGALQAAWGAELAPYMDPEVITGIVSWLSAH